MSLLGPEGFRELGNLIVSRARYAAKCLADVPGIQIVWPNSTFKEFVVNFDDTGKKVDVILSGMETFGSAERECDVDIMRNRFETIMNGDYRRKLIELFGEERVEAELKEYFDLKFIPRVGTGVGVTRLLKSMEKEGLL